MSDDEKRLPRTVDEYREWMAPRFEPHVAASINWEKSFAHFKAMVNEDNPELYRRVVN